MPRRALFLVTLFSFTPLAICAAQPTDLDKEYDQVRTIALRDPRVKAAFEKANERLESKIVEIDPALRGYAKGRPNAASLKRSVKPKAAPAPKPTVKSSRGSARTHVIATGDTLSTIAVRYKTTVGALKTANPTVDEKKLQVGDSLTVVPAPRHGSTP